MEKSMKHTSAVTLILVAVFLLSQATGLWIVDKYINHPSSEQAGEVVWNDLPYHFERPPVQNRTSSFIPIVIAIIIGTLLVLWLIRLRKPWILRLWFFGVVALTLSFSFAAFVPQGVALALAVFVAVWKMFRPNIFIHNISELFIYGGLAAIFVPMLNIYAAVLLLLFISAYDIVAVWKTKHMVGMAKFQAEAGMFAGLFIPYNAEGAPAPMGKKKPGKGTAMGTISPKAAKGVVRSGKGRVAVLGGGDMGFPLIFAGVVMKEAMLSLPHYAAFLKVLAIPACAGIALYILLLKGDKNKFYPAMPFISVGCLVGYGIFLLL